MQNKESKYLKLDENPLGPISFGQRHNKLVYMKQRNVEIKEKKAMRRNNKLGNKRIEVQK